MRRVDSHCHLWHLGRGDYTWLDTQNPFFAPIARDFQVDDLKPSIAPLDIKELVVVQAAATEAETDYLLSLADKHKDIVGVVGWADVESKTALETLTRWAAQTKFKGIRPMLQDIEATDWLINTPPPAVWKSLADLDLRFDALVQPRHLEMLHQFCTDNEALPIVIDHIAKPKQAFAGDANAFKEWAASMQKIGRETHACCKLSGVLTELVQSDIHNPINIIEPAINHMLECFGPSRLMWGSDWPVLTLVSNYQHWNDLSLQLLGELSSDEIAMILGGTAARFYGLGEIT